MVADAGDLAGEELRLVVSPAARAAVHPDVEDLVHAGVEGVGVEDLHQLVDNGENHLVQVGVEGAVALAVEAVGVGPCVGLGDLDPRSFVELRVNREQPAELLFPGLVAEEVDLRNDPDASLTARLDDLAHVGLAERVLVLELGV